jgi:hypothetical protein
MIAFDSLFVIAISVATFFIYRSQFTHVMTVRLYLRNRLDKKGRATINIIVGTTWIPLPIKIAPAEWDGTKLKKSDASHLAYNS